VSIPVIACGGAGSPEHIEKAITEGMADAVAISSVLHYDFIKHHKVEMNKTVEGNVEFLESGKVFSRIKPANLKEIKTYLFQKGHSCRYIRDEA